MRRSFTLCSIVVHAVVITAALIAQVVADGMLPTPHRPIMFDNSPFMPVEIQLPKPRVVAATPTSGAISENAAHRQNTCKRTSTSISGLPRPGYPKA